MNAHEWNAHDWTEAHPAGTEMIYTPVHVDGEPPKDDQDVVVRGRAWADYGNGATVALVEGLPGGVPVEYLRPRWMTESFVVTAEEMDACDGTGVFDYQGGPVGLRLEDRDDGGVNVTIRRRNVR